MRVRNPAGLLGVLLVAIQLAPGAVAEGFAAQLPFTDVGAASHLPVLSGTLDVRSPAGGAPTILHKVQGFQVDELAVVCWEYPCHEANGPLAVQVSAGSTIALRFPQTGDLHLRADHAVAVPAALDGDRAGFGELSAGLQLAPSLAAATKGGVLSVQNDALQPQPDGSVPASSPPGTPAILAGYFQAPDPDDRDAAVLATLTEGSRLEVLDGGRVVHVIEGYGGLLLQGVIHVPPVEAEAFVLPCAARCDLQVIDQGIVADLQAATTTVLDLVRLAEGGALAPVELGPWADLLDPVAGGVFVDFPLVTDPSQFSVADLTFVRFDRFQATLYPGAPAASGDGPLVIQSGAVQGSPEFVGGRYFGMPLWSYILWGLAIVAILVSAILRSPKTNKRWDRLRWVGRIAGAVALVALAFVWHANFGRVIGIDATSPGLDAAGRGIIAAVEVGTLLAMMAMVVLPTRILLSRAFRIVRQGRFMGLAGPAASVVGILVGTPLLLGFVDLALRMFQ